MTVCIKGQISTVSLWDRERRMPFGLLVGKGLCLRAAVLIGKVYGNKEGCGVYMVRH
jgi:hypothetical protein